ncbi:nephrin-like isoform X3 [Mercenaria mercenaria]|uniref:nephrin-like isoform X3 n=1 Tax=Mercenaria mercenaria TaxID=6596 RepID=UPI00234E3D8C|nr:nephrin-like isoform X3 [Mercenaria mercenaria]
MSVNCHIVWILNLMVFVLQREFVRAEVVLSPSTAVVSENNSVTLTCTYNGDETLPYVAWSVSKRSESTKSNTLGVITADCTAVVINVDTSLYNYTCLNNKQYTWTIKKVTRHNDGDKYRCDVDTPSPGNIRSNNVSLSVQVPVTSVTLVEPSTSPVTVNESTEAKFKCQASGGLPAASVSWYKDSGTSGDSSDDLEITSGIQSTPYTTNNLIEVTSILRYSPSRNENGWRIYCTASNILGQTPTVSERKPLLDVQYPPGPPVIAGYSDGGEYRVIEKTQGRLSCSVTGGNPAPTLTWNCFNSDTLETTSDGTVTKTHVWTAQRNQDRTCTCRSSHYSGERTVSIKIEVLYPPTTPTFRISSTQVNGTVKVIRNNQLSVSCISSGNPLPSYTWINADMASTNSQELSLRNVQNNGKCTCNVRNSMNPSIGTAAPGSNTAFIDVLILYPPTIGELKNTSVVERSPLTVFCPVTAGNPSQTTYEWIRNRKVWKRTQTFTIDTTSRNDAMFYTCKVSNRMVQTGEEPVSQPDTNAFYLNVWYKASVKEFFIFGHKGETSIVMNENDTVPFVCNVDSNPGSNISVDYKENVLKSQTDTKSLAYSIESASCTDRGEYSCVGFNKHNENHSSKLLNLLVNCSPRPSPSVTLKQNVTSAQHIPAVLTFTTLAYPDPNNDAFKWYRFDSNDWQLLSNSGEFQIETSNPQTNLTVKEVNRTYYGMYKLEISNSIGNYSQIFYLEAEDIPDPPKEFRLVAELVTEASITLQWKPGFDNGPDQTFILRYKKVSDDDWTSVSLPDAGEEVMNYTITMLSSGTEYEVILHATNALGISSETETLRITTTADDIPSQNTALLGGTIGGSVAFCAVVVIFVALLLLRRIKSKNNSDRSHDNKAVITR